MSVPVPLSAVRRGLLVGCGLLALAGCGSVGSLAGAAVGISTAAGTVNPVVGAAAALGTKAAVDALVKYVTRKRQQGEQDAIVAAVGALPVGGVATWKIRHTVPIGNAAGEVQVVRLIDTPLTQCKEAVFTVIDGTDREQYVTTACRQAAQWKWAQAEPATERWGFLQ